MDCLLQNALVYRNNTFEENDLLISKGKITRIAKEIQTSPEMQILNCKGTHLFPGFIDVHVHLREPGFLQKETIKTGTMAAAHGGYTTVCPMPNLNPVPDCRKTLQVELDAISRDAEIHVLPYGSITLEEKGKELSAMVEMSPFVAGFSDDGRGVQSDEIMLSAMKKAAALGKIIAAHCEVNSLLQGGYIHDGDYAKNHGHKGISSESEWRQIARDIELARKTGVKYHVCHISTKESVNLIRKAKRDGVNITCETGPHYLVFCDNDLQEDGRFKMNPPLRSPEDRDALIEGLLDGAIDMIATDHAPHEFEAKNKGLERSAMGVIGLETAFPVMYTHFVKTGILPLNRLIELMSLGPASRFSLDSGIEQGKNANITVFDLNRQYTISPEDFFSKARATPFAGMPVYGKCVLTICDGTPIWKDNSFFKKSTKESS